MSTWYYPKNVEDVTALLKHRREQLGYSQEQLEARCGVTQQTISEVEANDTCPLLRTIHRVFSGLNATPIYLVRRVSGVPVRYCRYEDVPERCRELRRTSTRTLAKCAGCGDSRIRAIESGENPTLRVYAAVAHALGVEPLAFRY